MTSEFVWVLIRQDEGGNRYRVGRFATRAEAEQVVGILGVSAGRSRGAVPVADGVGRDRRYVIERVVPRAVQG